MAPGILVQGGDSPSPRSGSEDGLSSAAAPLFHEPLAIVGMACRLPGGAVSPSKLWDLLVESRSGQCGMPADRFNIDGFYSEKGPTRPGSMNTAGGYFLQEDVRGFENDFFGISNLEATYMDPQQRKLLEVVYECFESSGATLEDVSGSNMGCYVGNFTVDFQVMQTKDSEYLSRYSATGMGTTILGNRISHAFNMKGPSLVLDTACSSSLYCLHTACLALLNGECDSAIVAGANLIQSPEQHFGTMKAGVLSKTSTCHSFDSSADGYGRADGIGALHVKRLSDALRNNDPIRSVIRGSAVNSNGKTSGITLPDSIGQEKVIRKAYEAAGLDTSATTYVECHGTGTQVGDPIEVAAVAAAFADQPQKVLIGSVKSGLGHSEAASGITSVIKVSMALENGLIPPTIGVQNPNPKLKLDERNVGIVTQNTPFPRLRSHNGQVHMPLRAGVNSFGYGGANAHIILEEASAWLPHGYEVHRKNQRPVSPVNPSQRFLLPFSASNDKALDTVVAAIADYCGQEVVISDLAYTLGSRKSTLANQGFVIASQAALKESISPSTLITKKTPNSVPEAPWAFVFTGQGAQWAQMGKQLIEQNPVFRRTIQDLDDTLSRLAHAPKWSLIDALLEPAETSKINDVTHSQPACTAIQIALVDLLRSYGLSPAAVVGHSSGEIAAAYAAGYLTAEEAITSAYYRGYAVGQMTTTGLMMAAGLSSDAANELIQEMQLVGQVRVACVNSPELVTLSGDEAAVETMIEVIKAKGVLSRKLVTGGRAYHSHQMTLIGDEYERVLRQGFARVKSNNGLAQVPRAQWFSSVTGELVDDSIDAKYWRDNLENPVLFSPALKKLLKSGSFQLIEIGPHSAMKLPIAQLRKSMKLAEAEAPYFNALTRGEDAVESLLKCLGSIWVSGTAMEFEKINGAQGGSDLKNRLKHTVLHDLPVYPWTYDNTLWTECRASEEYRNRKYPRHELLGSMVPGMNNVVHTWRNKLHVQDVAWLQDHRLDQTVVFPGAGYMAMVIEAVQQASDHYLDSDKERIHIRGMNILEALVLGESPTDDVEIFTTLQPLKISATTSSKSWWTFEVSSIQDKQAVMHATGSVRLVQAGKKLHRRTEVDGAAVEANAIRNWYDALIKCGLNFGKSFQSMKQISVDRKRTLTQARADTALVPHQIEADADAFSYAVHPITLDSMLQTAILASTAGYIRHLRAKVPVCIGEALIAKVPSTSTTSWQVDSTAESMGFGTTNIAADLFGSDGQVAATFTDVRLAPYEGAAPDQVHERHPMLRVTWKPDVLFDRLQDDNKLLDSYLEKASRVQYASLETGLAKYLATLDLVAHKSPRLRVLELGNDDNTISAAILDTLHIPSSFHRCSGYSRGRFLADDSFEAQDVDSTAAWDKSFVAATAEHQYDLVLLPNAEKTDQLLGGQLEAIKGLLRPQGLLLMRSPSQGYLHSAENGFEASQHKLTGGRIILSRLLPEKSVGDPVANLGQLFLVERPSAHSLNDVLGQRLQELGLQVDRVSFDALTSITPRSTVIMTAELDEPLLVSMNDAENARVKLITDTAANIVWVTGGNILRAEKPDFALINGLSRALVLEQPSTKIVTYDVDQAAVDTVRTADNIIGALRQVLQSESPDFEYVQREGSAHCSRFEPDQTLNRSWCSKQTGTTQDATVADARNTKLHIEHPGQFDTIRFVPVEPTPLASDGVQVDVRSVGLNAKDLYVLAGKVETKEGTCALEFAGVVTQVGTSVTDLAPGDRVVCMAPNHFQLTEQVPRWACIKLRPHEDFNVVATLGVVYSTAIYGLLDRANLQAGESVLIHSGAGGVGIAAIQIAQLAGAEIFATVSTEDKKNMLVEQFGLQADHIFSSRDSSFLDDVLAATHGRGVDVVLNSLTGDLLRDSWRCCASFGRFVEIGKRDIIDSGKLDMDVFLRNATFSAFDLSNVFYSDSAAMHDTWQSLLSRTMELYRAKKIGDIRPLEVFDISKLTEALRFFSSRNRMGKVAISLENDQSIIQVQPPKFAAKFSAEKAYLMIGCLGGLGKSISKWMTARGARKFVFMGRSGIDRPAARRLVEDLEAAGATISIVRGDVCSEEDVKASVAAAVALGPLGGVVQAAMGLNESLFTSMPNAYWHTGIDPKVAGTWHLHNHTLAHSSTLDFFLFTSSVSGSVGTATESNYCAANFFLDVFARYRHARGLPATSLGLGMISEVGYLHENPEIEALLLRKGIQAVNEDELLQIIDTSLTAQPTGYVYDAASRAHVLTGLEPLGLRELRKKGFEGNNPTLNDPRSALLAGALDGEGDSSLAASNGLPAELAAALAEASADKDEALRAAIEGIIQRRFSNLVLIQLEKIDMAKPLASYGMDSMIAAEFRTWFFQAFKVDIPFLELLSKGVTLSSLAGTVKLEVEARLAA